MINPERLLSTVLGEIMGGGHRGKKKRKNSLFSQLGTGTTLMTAIGLGVGAYEVFTQSKQASSTAGEASSPPPPPPIPGNSQPPPPPVPMETAQSDQIALLMIRTMIAAAHADGIFDRDEEQAILKRIQESDLNKDEKMFFLDELAHPKSLPELLETRPDQAGARAMYLAAVSAIAIDTPEERQWLDQLAAGLELSPTIQKFIEEQNEQ